MNLTKEIQMAIGKVKVLHGHKYVCENVNYLLNHELDVMSFRGGYMHEYEVKISRSDFLADSKKKKNRFNGTNGILIEKFNPNYFYYACPEGLIKPEEINENYGLIYFSEGELKWIKSAKLLHKFRHDENRIKDKLITLFQQRHFLGNCLMTYKNKQAKEAWEKRQEEAKNRRTIFNLEQ